MQLVYKKAEYEDISGLKHVWETVFGDSKQYINFFFEHAYKPGMAYVCKAENEVVGMLYLIPLFIGGQTVKTIKGGYIYAVATLPKWRGQQIATRLLHFVNASAKTELGYNFTMLKPAEHTLFDYYEKRGYQKYFKNCVLERKLDKNVEDSGFITGVSAQATPAKTAQMYKTRNEAFEKLPAHAYYGEDFFAYTIAEHAYKGGKIAFLKNGGYALLLEDEAAKTLQVSEIAAKSFAKEDLHRLLQALAYFYPEYNAVLTCPHLCGMVEGCKPQEGAMVLAVSEKGEEILTNTATYEGAAPYFALALD